MPIKRLSQMSLTSFQKHSNLLAGNPAYSPPAFDLLQTTVLGSDTTSVTFSNLNNFSQYRHLQIRGVTRRPAGGSFLNSGSYGVQLNGDTGGTSYSWHRLEGAGGLVSSSAGPNSNYGPDNVANGTPNDATGAFAGWVMDVLDFSNTSKNTTIRVLSGRSGTSTPIIGLYSGVWLNTNAVTSILIQERWGQFAANSRFSLYGIR